MECTRNSIGYNENIDTLLILSNLVDLLEKVGKYDDAFAFYNHKLDITEKILDQITRKHMKS